MKLLELNIERFGGLENKHIKLGEGMNLILGSNESGKSTIAEFIRYLFYGFSDGKEKKLLSDIVTGASSGNAVFETDDGQAFRISRSEVGSRRKSNVEVCTLSGELFEDWKTKSTPGEYFTTITANLYERSAFVSQREGAVLNAGTSDAVRNLMISGSENANLQRAIKKLDDCRVELLHKNGKGGRLFELEEKLDKERRSFSETEAKREAAHRESEDIANSEAELKNTELKIKATEKRALELRNAEIREALCEKQQAELELSENAAARSALEHAYNRNGFVPNAEYVRKLREAENSAIAKNSEYKLCKLKLDNAVNDASNAAGRGKTPQKVSKSLLLTGSVAIVLGIISFIFFIIEYLSKESSGINIPLLLSTVSLSSLGIILLIYRNKAIVKNGINDKAFSSEYSVEQATARFEQAESEKQKADETLRELLKAWGRDSVEQTIADAERYLEALESIDTERRFSEEKLRVAATKLTFYNAEEVEKVKATANVENQAAEKTDETDDINDIYRKLEELKARKSELYEHINAKKLSYAKNYSSLPSTPSSINYENAELTKEIMHLREEYASVTLAAETLKKADAELKNTVSPYLSSVAGELFSKLTGGRYQGLGIDGDGELMLSYLSDRGFTDSVYLSAGTTELAWLCLRLAIYKKICENVKLPLILDECFVRFDDTRPSSMLDYICTLCHNGTQAILFSANYREKQALSHRSDITITEL